MILCNVGDNTLKLWDIRQFRSPVHEVTSLDNHYAVYVLLYYVMLICSLVVQIVSLVQMKS